MGIPARSPKGHSVSARPRPDESLTGYIFRLAHRRRLPTAHLLASDVGFDRFTNRPEPSWLRSLAISAEIAVGELEAITYGPPDDAVCWFRGIKLPTNLFDRRGGADRRLCSLCLGEREHHRALWDLMCISVCPVHAVRLVDTCRSCGKALQWVGSDLTACTCTADLTRMPSERLQQADLRGDPSRSWYAGGWQVRVRRRLCADPSALPGPGARERRRVSLPGGPRACGSPPKGVLTGTAGRVGLGGPRSTQPRARGSGEMAGSVPRAVGNNADTFRKRDAVSKLAAICRGGRAMARNAAGELGSGDTPGFGRFQG